MKQDVKLLIIFNFLDFENGQTSIGNTVGTLVQFAQPADKQVFYSQNEGNLGCEICLLQIGF